ncbi:hypothetical protein [Actinoplanes sp. URMC 104]|uniref:hypothetical protein n=1 Tax=Actinoplanes sp. URMC 104 TaxID=3423409 RepID=UPI003F1BBB79
MDDAARQAVVAALVELATGDDHRDRADAGRALAAFAEMPAARVALHRLVLDGRDTYVTWRTAEALLRRHDALGTVIVAQALGEADDNHAHWIHTAIDDVFLLYAQERDAAVEALTGERGRGAELMREALLALRPILHPAHPWPPPGG